jgi:uncharacterized protein (TIGR03382 family)
MTSKLTLPIVLLVACVTPEETGSLGQEIVGGTTATTTTFPTVVALQHGNGNQFCTGVLVDKDWVLTAASCFTDTSATQARIGDANLTDGTTAGLTITIAEIDKHPQFSTNDTVWRHDVALVKLAQSVTDRTPTPINRTAMAVGTSFTQAGFGSNNNNGGGGGVLRSLATTNVDCAGAGDSGITNANLLCFNAADGTGSCYGDGGAPAFVGGGVAGVGSGGTGSSCTSGLDVYTSLVPELGFLDSKLPTTTNPNPNPNPPPPPPPPSDNPSNPDSGGSNTGPGSRNPNGADHGNSGAAMGMGCNAGGGTGWLAVLGVVLAVALRRRRIATC